MSEGVGHEYPCQNCQKHPKECECWVRDDFVKRCKKAEDILSFLYLSEESPRVLISVFVEAIKEITGRDSKSREEYEGKIEQLVNVLKMSCE